MHIHKWSKWEDIELTARPTALGRENDYKVPGQRRTCEKCGKAEVRKVTTT